MENNNRMDRNKHRQDRHLVNTNRMSKNRTRTFNWWTQTGQATGEQ